MAHYMSNRHQDVEAEFRKLPPAHQTTTVYVSLCRMAKIRETAIEARLSVLDLFGRKKDGAKKPHEAKPAEGKPEPKPATREEAEKIARDRNERRRAWESDFEDVEDEIVEPKHNGGR